MKTRKIFKSKKIRKTKDILLRSILLLEVLIIIAAVFTGLLNSYVKNVSAKYIYSYGNISKIDKNKKYDAVIILGARVYSATSVSPMLRDRLLVGYEIYAEGLADKIIVSGDHTSANYDEVLAMKLFLMKKGVPREDIFMDHAGVNTYDSMYRAKNIFRVSKAIVVTQRYHLFRAVYTGKNIGLDIIGVNSDLDTYSGMLYNNLREYIARDKAFLDSEILKRNPRFTGKQIPVRTSSGLVTEDAGEKQILDGYGY